MKRFVPYLSSNVFGILFDDDCHPRPAMFLAPAQAKFEAAFKTLQTVQSGGVQ